MSLQPFALGDAAQPAPMLEEFIQRVIKDYAAAIAGLFLASARASAQAQATMAIAAMRLHAQAEVHRMLQPPLGDDPMDLGDYVTQLTSCLCRARFGERGVRVSVCVENLALDPARCWRVGLIVAGLVNNLARCALRGDGPGVIWVEISQRSGRVICRVCDDSLGRTDKPEVGTRTIKGLAKELGGGIKWTFGVTGCTASLEFPATPPCAPSAERLALQDNLAGVGELIRTETDKTGQKRPITLVPCGHTSALGSNPRERTDEP